MTPFQLDILFHYYCRAADWRNGDHSAPICKETFDWFLAEGLVKHANFHVERFEDGAVKARYALTERGMAYVGAIMRVPLPVRAWIVPEQSEYKIKETPIFIGEV